MGTGPMMATILRRQCALGVCARRWPGVGRCLYVPALQEAGCGHVPGGLDAPGRRDRLVVRCGCCPGRRRSALGQRCRHRRHRPCGFSPSLLVSPSGSVWVSTRLRLVVTRSAAGRSAACPGFLPARFTTPPPRSMAGSKVSVTPPSKAEWGKVGGLGLANWLTDIGVLAMSILALGGAVPWRSLLLVYGLATLIGSLGITPGGLGLVEGTLCLGLVSTGVPAALALAAVLLYRLVSFWLVMATGWLVLLWLRLERPFALCPSRQALRYELQRSDPFAHIGPRSDVLRVSMP